MLSPSNGFHNRHLPDAPHRSCRRQTHGYRHHGHNYQKLPPGQCPGITPPGCYQGPEKGPVQRQSHGTAEDRATRPYR